MTTIEPIIKKAKEILLNKRFVQKGCNFSNLVTHISKNSENEIIVTYTTKAPPINLSSTMELEQFKDSHYMRINF